MKPIVVWRVAAGEGTTVQAVAAHAGLDGGLRAFVNGRRAEWSQAVEIGDTIQFYEPRHAVAEGVSIVAQRDGVLLVSKPAGLPTEPTPHGDESVVAAVLSQLKGGRVHAASRLDTMVSGVVMLTLGKNAARRVEQWRQRRQVQSTYLALVQRGLSSQEGSWDFPLAKGRNRAGQVCARTAVAGQKPARTMFRVHARAGALRLLELKPQTGRFHQLRAHASFAKVPLVGDVRYGGATHICLEGGQVVACERVALHCASVCLPGLTAKMPVPQDMMDLWEASGGSARQLLTWDAAATEG